MDVGYRGAGVYRRHPAYPPWDVVLLTHNDEDHVGDVADFFGSSRRIANEVWMPYEWRLFYDAALDLAKRMRRKGAGVPTAAAIADARARITDMVEGIRRAARDAPADPDNGDPPWLDRGLRRGRSYEEDGNRPAGRLSADIVHAIGLIEVRVSPPGMHPEQHDIDAEPPATHVGAFMADAIGSVLDEPTVASIRTAVNTAWGLGSAKAVGGSVVKPSTVRAVDAVVASGARCRWFSVDHAERFPKLPTGEEPWQISGVPNIFTVVNAWPLDPSGVPGAPPPIDPAESITAVAALAYLTMQNRRALVALGHGWPSLVTYPRRGGGILFASDSGFDFDKPKRKTPATNPVPWDLIGAVVGLHHGSHLKEHNHVYERMRDIPSVVMARSGSMDTTRTNDGFAQLPAPHRGCRWCHQNSNSPTRCIDRPRDVVIEGGHASRWTVSKGACTDCPRFP